jgi:ketosteroid isomerase-like protein
VSEESTTPDLEEALRRSMEAVNQRNLDAAMIRYTPNAVWDTSPIGVDVFEGREAIRGFFEVWWSSYEDFEQVLEEFRDLGNGRAHAFGRDVRGSRTAKREPSACWRRLESTSPAAASPEITSGVRRLSPDLANISFAGSGECRLVRSSDSRSRSRRSGPGWSCLPSWVRSAS